MMNQTRNSNDAGMVKLVDESSIRAKMGLVLGAVLISIVFISAARCGCRLVLGTISSSRWRLAG